MPDIEFSSICVYLYLADQSSCLSLCKGLSFKRHVFSRFLVYRAQNSLNMNIAPQLTPGKEVAADMSYSELEMEASYESIPLLPPGNEKYGVDTGTLSMFGAALFIVGEMTGSGILGVPQALAHSGYTGVALMCLCVCVASYTGLTLSRNWMHVRDQYPSCRQPFASIGYTAYGKLGEIMVQICATVTLWGGCCAYILIAANCLARFIELAFGEAVFGNRVAVLIMAAVFLVVLIFGAGKESLTLFVAVFATVLSAVFSALIVYGIVMTGKSEDFKPYKITPKSWFLSFGKFLFAFGGHSAFPNFQKEMKRPRNFPGSILIAFMIKLVLYIPLGILGMLYFGSDVQNSILDNIDDKLRVLNVCILFIVAFQGIMSATILGNPVAVMVEGLVNAPAHTEPSINLGSVKPDDATVESSESFDQTPTCEGACNMKRSWNAMIETIKGLLNPKRLAVRCGFVLGTVILCEAIPRFDLIMALIGGTTINAAVFILPSLFHIKLAKHDKWRNFKITLDYLTIAFGVLAGGVCTYASVAHIIDEYSTIPLGIEGCWNVTEPLLYIIS